MYNETDRENLYNDIINKINNCDLLEGAYKIGSVSNGYRDIYSDIDLMIAYKENEDVLFVQNSIIKFFDNYEIGYINKRQWTDTIWGISVYLKNGLSLDISFGPLKELKISSNQIDIAIDKYGKVKEEFDKKMNEFKLNPNKYKIDNQINVMFMYLLRMFLIAIKRKNYFYAYIMLNDARKIIMDIQALNEDKKLHQFKAYNELNKEFLNELKNTIPKDISEEELVKKYELILNLYMKTIKECKNLQFDEKLMCLLVIAD